MRVFLSLMLSVSASYSMNPDEETKQQIQQLRKDPSPVGTSSLKTASTGSSFVDCIVECQGEAPFLPPVGDYFLKAPLRDENVDSWLLSLPLLRGERIYFYTPNMENTHLSGVYSWPTLAALALNRPKGITVQFNMMYKGFGANSEHDFLLRYENEKFLICPLFDSLGQRRIFSRLFDNSIVSTANHESYLSINKSLQNSILPKEDEKKNATVNDLLNKSLQSSVLRMELGEHATVNDLRHISTTIFFLENMQKRLSEIKKQNASDGLPYQHVSLPAPTDSLLRFDPHRFSSEGESNSDSGKINLPGQLPLRVSVLRDRFMQPYLLNREPTWPEKQESQLKYRTGLRHVVFGPVNVYTHCFSYSFKEGIPGSLSFLPDGNSNEHFKSLPQEECPPVFSLFPKDVVPPATRVYSPPPVPFSNILDPNNPSVYPSVCFSLPQFFSEKLSKNNFLLQFTQSFMPRDSIVVGDSCLCSVPPTLVPPNAVRSSIPFFSSRLFQHRNGVYFDSGDHFPPPLSAVTALSYPVGTPFPAPIQGTSIPVTGEPLALSYRKLKSIEGFQRFCELTYTPLDLSHNYIRDITPLAFFMRLVRLSLCNNEIENIEPLSTCLFLQFLDISANPISSIEALKPLKYLRQVYLDATCVTDLNPLRKKEFLQVIKAQMIPLDVSTLSDPPNSISVFDFPALQFLDLSDCGICDVQKVFFSPSLTHLYLSRNKLSTIEGLNNNKLSRLRSLYIDGNEIVNLDPLKRCELLRTLHASANKINPNTLPALGELKALNLSHNDFEGVDLGCFPDGLAHLHLNKTRINKLDGLKNLQGLVSLSIDFCPKIDYGTFPSFPKLRFLSANRTEMGNMEFLKNTPNLMYLEVPSNGIILVDTIPTHLPLKTLNLTDNRIKNIDKLKYFKQLDILLLARNDISDISVLKELSEGASAGLNFLDITANPVENLEPLKYCSASMLRLMLGDKCDLRTLPFLPFLQTLIVTEESLINLWKSYMK